MRHVLVLADSLAFYGPERGEISTDPRLFPNVLASRLSTVDSPVTADVVARVGWTSRDVWWAMTPRPVPLLGFVGSRGCRGTRRRRNGLFADDRTDLAA
ncbi:hypothetical protein [Fodinicola feengrottensis]|uniref:hypothetical protein n=1 Tax=Fodinicola feengrottensis TaxID=435914 RepID=UPI0013D3BE69|nr:hypothetical protein [Fodinicola feengrottensis]